MIYLGLLRLRQKSFAIGNNLAKQGKPFAHRFYMRISVRIKIYFFHIVLHKLLGFGKINGKTGTYCA